MALAPDGTVFVGSFGLFSGNPKIGNVYAVRGTNRDGRADADGSGREVYARGVRNSAGMAYRIAVVCIQDGTSSGQEVFAGGFFDGKEVMVRPVDVLQLAGGSLVVSDDLQGKIYRLTYRE